MKLNGRYFKNKIVGIRIYRKLKKGEKKLKNGKLLLAYEDFHIISEEYKDIKNQQDLLEKAKQNEQIALNQLEVQIEDLVHQIMAEIEGFQGENKINDILELYNHFLEKSERVHKTEKIIELYGLLQKKRNDVLVNIWESSYRVVFAKIKDLLNTQAKDEAIYIGKDFLEKIEECPKITGLNILRDRIFSLIEGPITQKWEANYKIIKIESRNLSTRSQFINVISKLEAFLRETLKDSNIDAVRQLRERAKRMLREIRKSQPQIERRATFYDLVAMAQENYDNAKYELAIYYTDEAIKLMKNANLNGETIFLRDTSEHVKIVQFKYYCQDRIIEREIQNKIDKARGLLYSRKRIESKKLMQKAQKLCDKLSPRYKQDERSMYKDLIREIRNFLLIPF